MNQSFHASAHIKLGHGRHFPGEQNFKSSRVFLLLSRHKFLLLLMELTSHDIALEIRKQFFHAV